MIAGVLVLLATLTNTVLVAVVARRLLGIDAGWPRTLLLSALATTATSQPLEQLLDWLGVPPPQDGLHNPVAAVMVGLLFFGWVLALEVSVLAVAEAVVPTGTWPGPLSMIRGIPGWARRTRRYLRIMTIAARHGLMRYLGRSRSVPDEDVPRRDTAVALREALTDGGVTFVKLGQMLVTRPDLLPARYIEELSRLHSNVPPEPWTAAKATLRRELGTDLASVFSVIEPEPLAAASVGQVHRAILRTGEPVVVKVQRASAPTLVRSDLDIITRLAAVTERRTAWARRLGMIGLAEGFRRSLDAELDYRVELRNLTSLRAGDKVVIPRAYPHHSTRRILTMEQLEGTPLSSAASKIAALDPQVRLELAEALLDVVLRQVFIDGAFHADLHGGNVLLLEDERLALLDFGAVGRMDRGARLTLVALLLAADRHDGAGAAAALARLLEAPADVDARRLERQVADLVARVGSMPVEPLFRELFAIAVEHQLRVPPPVAAAFRAIGALEGTLHLLSPGVDVIALARERAGNIAWSSMVGGDLREEVRAQLSTTLPAVRRLPDQVASIVHRLDQPNLGLRLSLVSDPHGGQFLRGLVQQFVLAILAAASAACGTAFVLSEVGPWLAPRLRLSTYVGLVLLLFAYLLGSRLVGLAFHGHVRERAPTADRRF